MDNSVIIVLFGSILLQRVPIYNYSGRDESQVMATTAKGIEKIKKGVQARKEPQQERAKQTVAKILNGARVILEREGRKGLSARKLAKECGMSTGSIYDHFPGISAVLFALNEERMNQEMEVYRDFEKRDTENTSMEEWIDAFVQQDATLEWGSALDLELEEAIKQDEKLKQLKMHSIAQQRQFLVEALRKRNAHAKDSQLEALASFLIGLSDLSFQLRHVDKLTEKKLILDATIDLAKRLATYPLPE